MGLTEVAIGHEVFLLAMKEFAKEMPNVVLESGLSVSNATRTKKPDTYVFQIKGKNGRRVSKRKLKTLLEECEYLPTRVNLKVERKGNKYIGSCFSKAYFVKVQGNRLIEDYCPIGLVKVELEKLDLIMVTKVRKKCSPNTSLLNK